MKNGHSFYWMKNLSKQSNNQIPKRFETIKKIVDRLILIYGLLKTIMQIWWIIHNWLNLNRQSIDLVNRFKPWTKLILQWFLFNERIN